MYIYIDIIILVNLFINTLILLLTAWILGIHYKKLRVFAAVITTVVYVILFIKYPNSLWSYPFIKFIFSILIIWIAFGKRTWRQFFLALGSFYLISFVLGGAVIGYYFFSQNVVSVEGLNYKELSFNLKSIGQGLMVGCLLMYCFIKSMIRQKAKLNYIHELYLENNNHSIIVKGFFDSGNHLYDMTGGKPVILVEQTALTPLFSAYVNNFLEEFNNKDWFTNWQECQDEQWKKSIAIISYQAIGASDLLIGQRIHKVKVKNANDWCEFDCVIGIYPKSLSMDGSYQALLHASMCID